MTDPYN